MVETSFSDAIYFWRMLFSSILQGNFLRRMYQMFTYEPGGRGLSISQKFPGTLSSSGYSGVFRTPGRLPSNMQCGNSQGIKMRHLRIHIICSSALRAHCLSVPDVLWIRKLFTWILSRCLFVPVISIGRGILVLITPSLLTMRVQEYLFLFIY